MEKTRNEMLHEALDQILVQADRVKGGQLGTINMAVRHDSRVGTHVHASATIRHRIFVSVDETNGPEEMKY